MASELNIGWKKGFRLSPSAIDLLHTCPRKFSLDRLSGLAVDEIELASREVHFSYGHAIEAGVVSYLKSGSVDAAVLDAWLRYGNDESEKKCLESVVAGIRQLALIWPSNEWKLLDTQIGFKITFDDDFGGYYCGYIDAGIQNNYIDTIAGVECKTTGSNMQNVDAMYQNTEQAIAYPTVLSFIHKSVLSQYACLYTIFRVNKSWVPTIEIKPYVKDKTAMIEWLLGLRLTYENLKQYVAYDYWPMYGHSCIKYNKPCYYFGMCNLQVDLPSVELPSIGDQTSEAKEEAEFEHVISFSELFDWVRSLP